MILLQARIELFPIVASSTGNHEFDDIYVDVPLDVKVTLSSSKIARNDGSVGEVKQIYLILVADIVRGRRFYKFNVDGESAIMLISAD